MGAETSNNEKDPASNETALITPGLEDQPCEHPSENEFKGLAQLQKNNPVLGYLEEEEPSRHDNSVEGAPRRQTANRRTQAPAGAYSGAAGEDYQRLRKVENCAGQLGGVLSNSEGNVNNVNVLEATLEPENPKWWQQKQFIVIGLVIASLLVALSIAIPVALLQRGHSEDPAIEGGFQIEEIKIIRDIDYGALIPNITNRTINAIKEDPFSQQFQAYNFIIGDRDWKSYENWRKKQRYAVACYLYAFHPMSVFWPRHGLHECNWMRFTKPCNEMGKLTSLRVGHVLHGFNRTSGGNDMPGTMPPEIGFLSHIEWFEITNFALGSVEKVLTPDFLQSVHPRLTELRLRGDDLVGTIPSTLGLLTGLTSLDLRNNGFTGSIPEEIGNLPNLTIFNVEDNSGLEAEASLPSGFCSDARLLPWDTLLTDWCKSSEECCGTS